MGFNVQGDLGGWTFYTTQRGEVVFFPKSPPLNPPTAKQMVQRCKFAQAGKLWKCKTEEAREQWRLAVRRANLRLTGYNLWTYWITTSDEPALRTIERETNLVLI